jgi:hypothetical protein
LAPYSDLKSQRTLTFKFATFAAALQSYLFRALFFWSFIPFPLINSTRNVIRFETAARTAPGGQSARSNRSSDEITDKPTSTDPAANAPSNEFTHKIAH